jgi:hypothetical protein
MSPIKEFPGKVKQPEKKPSTAKERLEMEKRTRIAKEVYKKHKALMDRLKDA